MIIHDVRQGGEEWMRLRLGIPTASQFDRLLTPKTRKPAAARAKYRAELLTEWLLGQPLEWGSSTWMDRGTGMEDEARRFYEFERDAEVERTGFISRQDGQAGGSPDGLVGRDGGLEIKCPAALQHVQYMLGDDLEYVGQVQGYMYLTGRAWWDVISYNPALPPVITRVARDEDYIGALVPVLDEFVKQLERDKSQLAEHRLRGPALDFAPMTEDEVAAFTADMMAHADVDPRFAAEAQAAAFEGRWYSARQAWKAVRGARPRGLAAV